MYNSFHKFRTIANLSWYEMANLHFPNILLHEQGEREKTYHPTTKYSNVLKYRNLIA